MSDRIPSCIRAPPAAENSTSGRFSFTARSAAATMALPTYIPMDPPMKEKSCAAATMGVRPISPSATSMASVSPVPFWAAFIRSGYFFWSRNWSGSASGSGTFTSVKTPASNSAAKRARGVICMWWLQFEQT